MRKRLQLLFILLIGISYKAQDNTLAAAVNTPAAYQTGVPDISFPLVSLPATKDMTINFGLAYNANSYKRGSFSGLIAKNWALTGSNFTITRQIQDDWPDEIEVEDNGNDIWNDTYYYNLNGEQGSFKFERSGIYPNDIYKVIKLTPSNLIIDCQRIATTGGWLGRIVQSFTVTDSKGYKYYFTDHDESRFYYPISINGVDTYPYLKLRNTFYVTRVEDASNRTVATFNNTKYENDANNAWSFVPERVTTAYGSIVFEHGDSNEANYNYDFPIQDRYFIKGIALKDHKGNFISQSRLKISSTHEQEPLSYNGGVDIWYRNLLEMTRVDKDDNIIDKISLGARGYTNAPYGTTGNVDTIIELLGGIQYTSGQMISYDFGYNKVKNPKDYNDPIYIPYLQDPDVYINGIHEYHTRKEYNIDTKITKKYPLPASIFSYPRTRISIGFSIGELYPNGTTDNPTLGPENLPQIFEYRLVDPVSGYATPYGIHGMNLVINPSHNVYLEINGSGGKGTFVISEKDYLPPPYDTFINSGFPVVQSVKYYDITEGTQPSNTYNNYDLKKTINYDYNFFDNSGLPSGILSIDQDNVMIYKNIKITESDKPGYTKYYFKTADDYPGYYAGDKLVWPNFNLIKNGLLRKKEVYDANNIKRHETLYDYIFPPYDEARQYKYNATNSIYGYIYTAESFFDKITTTDISKDLSGNSLTDISEKTFNQSNNNLMSEKRTAADGTVSETTYQYAAEKNNTKLLGANMFSVPLEVTQKQNSLAIGKLETRYDQTANYFPSSVKSFGINNVVTGEQVNDLYDSMGNVLQTTSRTGVPTAIIWGYNGTQPIAKIEGAEYFNVLSLMGEPNVNLLDIVQRSDQDVDDAKEQLLRDALEAFRRKPAFKNYLITTYTYDPLIGVKSMTTPNGFTEYYYYDNQNRPTRVEDGDHNIIRENRYQQNVFQNQN